MSILKLLLFVLVGLPVLKAVIFKVILLLSSLLLLWTFRRNYDVSWTLGVCICFYAYLSVTLLSVVFYIFNRNKESRFVKSWLWTASTTYVRIFCWLAGFWYKIIWWMVVGEWNQWRSRGGKNWLFYPINFYISCWTTLYFYQHCNKLDLLRATSGSGKKGPNKMTKEH